MFPWSAAQVTADGAGLNRHRPIRWDGICSATWRRDRIPYRFRMKHKPPARMVRLGSPACRFNKCGFSDQPARRGAAPAAPAPIQ